MILLLPVGILLLASLAIFILDQIRPKFGTSWLIASITSAVAWLTILILRLYLPTTLEIFSWEQVAPGFLGDFSLLLDYGNWPYVFALITIALSVILTDAARTRYDSTPQSWSASLMITAISLMALLSGTSLMLMVTWAIVDLVKLVYLLRLETAQQFTLRIIISYGVRMLSILMVFYATTLAWQVNGSFDLTAIPQKAGFVFLLAAGLRLGVFPLTLPFLQEPDLRRGAGNIIRLAPTITSLSLLARLPADLIPQGLQSWEPLFHVLLLLAGFYAAVRWLRASDEIAGRPFWIIAWSALATASVLNGAPAASLAWGIALILPGSLLFLYYPRIQRMNFLLYFGLIGLVGLPFTPIASGWAGFTADGFNVFSILYLLIHTMMVLGYLNRILQPGGEPGTLESWARLVYPLGLIFIIQAIFSLGLIGWPSSLTVGVWWLPLISNLLIIGIILLANKLGISPPNYTLPASSRMAKVFETIMPRLEPILRLEWLYKVMWRINNWIGKLLNAISTLLESEGGILWTFILLVLLISLLSGGGLN
jgi:hypothetical protein